jgi:hypothetical protein
MNRRHTCLLKVEVGSTLLAIFFYYYTSSTADSQPVVTGVANHFTSVAVCNSYQRTHRGPQNYGRLEKTVSRTSTADASAETHLVRIS